MKKFLLFLFAAGVLTSCTIVRGYIADGAY